MRVRNATLADVAGMATCASLAMMDDDFVAHLFPHRREHYTSFRRTFLRRAKKRFYAGHTLFVMVTDEKDPEWNGKEMVIGYLGMSCTGGSRPSSPISYYGVLNSNLNWLEDKYTYWLGLDKSVNYKHLGSFHQSMLAQGPYDYYKEFWDVEHLSVHPSFQRRGVGQQLVKAAQKMAAEDKLPLLLVASTKGVGLYMKCGFTRIADVNDGHFSAPALKWTAEA